MAVAYIGGCSSVAGAKLQMLLPADCPPEFKGAIRQHKSALLELLRLDFLVVDWAGGDPEIRFYPGGIS